MPMHAADIRPSLALHVQAFVSFPFTPFFRVLPDSATQILQSNPPCFTCNVPAGGAAKVGLGTSLSSRCYASLHGAQDSTIRPIMQNTTGVSDKY